jgi:hypothetical protein
MEDCFIFLAINRQQRLSREIARKVGEARRSGKGLKVQDWQLEGCDEQRLHEAVETIIVWCRDTLAGCRRPYGIDSFDLTLALGATGQKSASVRLDKLRPIELYQDSLPQRLAGFLCAEATRLRSASLHLTAALFSWGDAAYQALPQRS